MTKCKLIMPGFTTKVHSAQTLPNSLTVPFIRGLVHRLMRDMHVKERTFKTVIVCIHIQIISKPTTLRLLTFCQRSCIVTLPVHLIWCNLFVMRLTSSTITLSTLIRSTLQQTLNSVTVSIEYSLQVVNVRVVQINYCIMHLCSDCEYGSVIEVGWRSRTLSLSWRVDAHKQGTNDGTRHFASHGVWRLWRAWGLGGRWVSCCIIANIA